MENRGRYSEHNSGMTMKRNVLNLLDYAVTNKSCNVPTLQDLLITV